MPKVKDFELDSFESDDYRPFQKTKHKKNKEPKKGKYAEKKDYRKNYVDNSEIDWDSDM
mgnify:FL=1